MDIAIYSEITNTLYHFAKRIFFDIYPLSREEFEVDGIRRRAAEDYLIQLIEQSRGFVRIIMSDFKLGDTKDSYYKDFTEGTRIGILPQELGNKLINLARIRNDVVHENNKVKERKILYGKLGIIVTISYAMYELAKFFSELKNNAVSPKDEVLICKDYLMERLKIMESNNRHSELVKNECSRTRFRLQYDHSIPDILINKQKIKFAVKKNNQVFSKGFPIMKNDGKRLERLVRIVEDILLPKGFSATPNYKIFDENGIQVAELDLLITGEIGSMPYKGLIECRDRPSQGAEPAQWIQGLIGRRMSLHLDHVVAVSTTGFSPEAIREAKIYDIELREIKEVTEDVITGWISKAKVNYRQNNGQLTLVNFALISLSTDTNTNLVDKFFLELNNNDKVFIDSETKECFSISEIWIAYAILKNLFEKIQPGNPPQHYIFPINFTYRKRHYSLIIYGKEYIVAGLVFEADLSVTVSEIPVSRPSKYARVDENEPIAQAVHFQIPKDGINIEYGLVETKTIEATQITLTAHVIKTKSHRKDVRKGSGSLSSTSK